MISSENLFSSKEGERAPLNIYACFLENRERMGCLFFFAYYFQILFNKIILMLRDMMKYSIHYGDFHFSLNKNTISNLEDVRVFMYVYEWINIVSTEGRG